MRRKPFSLMASPKSSMGTTAFPSDGRSSVMIPSPHPAARENSFADRPSRIGFARTQRHALQGPAIHGRASWYRSRCVRLMAMGETETGSVRIEPCHKRVRAYLDREVVVDSVHPMLVWEHNRYPAYYLPEKDVAGGRI